MKNVSLVFSVVRDSDIRHLNRVTLPTATTSSLCFSCKHLFLNNLLKDSSKLGSAKFSEI